MRLWAKVWVLLILGYCLFGRSFAYLGVPQLKLFIGEAVLAGFFLFRPRATLGRWASWLLRPRPGGLFALAWSLVAFFLYGAFQVFRGLGRGHDPLLALQNFVFNAYPLYLFLGVAVGLRFPDLLPRVVRWLAWLSGLYGVLYLLVLSRLGLSLPWAPEVPLFGQPGGYVLALLGLLVFEPHFGKVWPLFLLNLLVLLGVQVRSQWLAFAVALTIWALLRRKMPRLVALGALFFLLFVFLYISDLRLPAPEPRGGELSARGLIARVIAPFDPDRAAKLIGEEAYSFAGTITGWRIPWWASIWEAVHEDEATALLGLGYGYPLWELFPVIPEGIRTPHNAFFYSLGYSGWVGVLLFLLFLGTLLLALLKASRLSATGEFAFCMAFGLWASGLVGNFFETPFGAIPFYLMAGFGLAPLLRGYAHLRAPHLLPTARR